MDESERKAAIEKRFNIELQETPKAGVYRVHVDGVQLVLRRVHRRRGRFNIELQETPKAVVYRVPVDGVQQWFMGYPPALTLDQVEQVMRWLAKNHMDWRE